MSCSDGGAHGARRRPCGQPGMHLCLDGRPGPLWLRNAVNELLGEGPDDILHRDHVGYQIFKLSGILVVGHEPDPDARVPLNHDSPVVRFAGQRDATAFAAVTNRLPACAGIIVGVYDHSHSRPARRGQLDGNALGEFRESALLDDAEIARQFGPGAQLSDNVLVVRPFHEQHTVGSAARQSHPAVT